MNKVKVLFLEAFIFAGAFSASAQEWIGVNRDDYPDHAVYGMMSSFTYGGKTYNTWWPAAGVRTIGGKLGDGGFRGMYYHYDHISATHGGHGSGFAFNQNWATGIMTNHASSVRCVRDKQFDTSGNPTIPLRGWDISE